MTISMRFALTVRGRFTPEEDVRARMKEVRAALDREGLDGAVYMMCDGIELIGEHEHDFVDQLLAYIVDGLDDIVQGKPFVTGFPDQPLQLGIRTTREVITVTVDHKKAVAPRREFLRELYGLCRRFFDLMLVLYPSGWDEPYVKKLQELSQKHPDVFA